MVTFLCGFAAGFAAALLFVIVTANTFDGDIFPW